MLTRTALAVCISLKLLFLAVTPSLAGQSLSLDAPTGSATPGATISIDIRWQRLAASPPSALQWTMQYATGELSLLQVVAASSAVQSGKSVSCSTGFSSVTCVLSGINQAAMADGVVGRALFRVLALPQGASSVQLMDVRGSLPDGTALAVPGGTRVAVIGTLPIGQNPAPGCTYTLSPAAHTLSAASVTATILVSAPLGCPWQAQSGAPWITIAGPSSGFGNGSITYQAQSNPGDARNGSILIAGRTFSVGQARLDGSLPFTSLASASMAHIATGAAWQTTITMANSGNTPAQVHLDFFGNDGNPLSLPVTFLQPPGAGPAQDVTSIDLTLNPRATFVMQTDAGSSGLEGWAQMLSTVPVEGFVIFTNTWSSQEAVIPMETNAASPQVLAFDNTGVIDTGVALTNASPFPTRIPVRILNDEGEPIGSDVIDLPSHGHISFLLKSRYEFTAGVRGTLQFIPPTGGRIAVTGLRAKGTALTTLPALNTAIGPGGGSIAHVASGFGWRTTFTIVNTGTQASQASMSFFGDSGAALPLAVGNLSTGTSITAAVTSNSIPGGASLVTVTPPGDSVSSLVVGSARVAVQGAAPSVQGFAIFGFDYTGQEAAVPIETRDASGYILAFDNTGDLSSGVALANLSPQSAAIGVLIRDENGLILTSDAILLSANGHISFMLPARFVTTANRRGTVEFVTPQGGRISVIGLRATAAGTLTTLPVIARTD